MRLVFAPAIHAAGETGAIDSISAIFVLSKVISFFVSFCIELNAILFSLVQKEVKRCGPVNRTLTIILMVIN